MRLFGKKPQSKEIADIDIARTARDTLIARLNAAERAVSERHADVRRLAIADDEAALGAAESAMRAAQDRLATLQDAVADADQRVREAEQRRDAAEDQKQRDETANAIDEVAAGLNQVGNKFAILMKEMSSLTERAAAITFAANGLHGFSMRAATEVPESCSLMAQELSGIAKETRNGCGPATLPQPVQQTQPPRQVPQPATARVFAVKPIKWLDANGDLRIGPEFFDVDLPPDVAAHAIELDAAVPIDHPRRRQMQGHGRVYRPDPSRCVSLIPGDDSQPQPRPELVPGVAFEPLQEQRATYAVPAFGA